MLNSLIYIRYGKLLLSIIYNDAYFDLQIDGLLFFITYVIKL